MVRPVRFPPARPAALALEKVVRRWRLGSRHAEAERERALHDSRTFSVFPDDQGMYAAHGRLDPEVGALFMRAIEAAADALYRKHREPRIPGATPAPEDESARAAAQRRADAVGLLAERALAAGFGGTEQSAGRLGETLGHAASAPVPVSGSRAERYQVVLHVDAATLSADGEPGRCHLEDGTRVSAETSRRLACGSSIDAWSAAARWKREADIPDEVYLRAMEALGSG